MTHLIHIVSHPIQYYTPLYKQIGADKDFDFQVWFCSKHGLEQQLDKEFGVAVQWDIPLLEGYRHEFLKNHARQETLDSFMGLSNWGIVQKLFKAPRKSIIWIHGWGYCTLLLAWLAGKLAGHKVLFRGDNTAVIEENRATSLPTKIKTGLFKKIIFPITNGFLAVGNQNKAYYNLMGVPQNKIFFAPHAIDNQRFMQFYNNNKHTISSIKKDLGIPLSKKVIICSGKYIDKKKPLDLLKALTLLPNRQDVFVVFVGEGNLRTEMEAFIATHQLQDQVLLTGFVNQSQMPRYYLIADLYVMCSGLWETWGLSTNEALCFGLPVVLSHMVGSAYDLIEGNGFMFQAGDVAALRHHIHHILTLPQAEYEQMRQKSLELIGRYDYEHIIKGIKQAA